MKIAWLLIPLVCLSGCTMKGELESGTNKPTQTRFEVENSENLPFSLYRDKRTNRLYAYCGHGGLTEINDEPSNNEEVTK